MEYERSQNPRRPEPNPGRKKIPIQWQIKPAPVDEDEEDLEDIVERVAEEHGISIEEAVRYIEQHFEEEERDPVGTQLRMYTWGAMN